MCQSQLFTVLRSAAAGPGYRVLCWDTAVCAGVANTGWHTLACSHLLWCAFTALRHAVLPQDTTACGAADVGVWRLLGTWGFVGVVVEQSVHRRERGVVCCLRESQSIHISSTVCCFARLGSPRHMQCVTPLHQSVCLCAFCKVMQWPCGIASPRFVFWLAQSP